ncbi:GNAT family N-acetyltransferase [Halorubrum sp. AD140]|uniref:GNAT family N-acetyltransferase n=1 Tax=Halorubrum sp. AD140 TaxID=3050073 RepID=UPI002ACCA690|nr:GNAT family N-acetyltransferase [Halorubrum sp. AD140]MDZ5810213.1 GNAT family N-acetyltransferase [Halorubrum sp. AD140]
MPSDDDYTIRLYEPADREGFLRLYDEVFGGGTEAWFRWKYPDNPYVAHVPMFVAERDGEIVGARPYMAFRLRNGDRTALGLQTGDTMVHPDHQRRGLFTRMTRQSFDYYGDLDGDVLTFSIPNALSRPGYLKLGCREVGQLATAYRIQDPGALASGAVARAGGAAAPLIRLGQGLWSRRSPTPDDVTVVHHDAVPAGTLSALYEERPPDGVHALRDERFYDWRFDRPDWDYETYVARTTDRAEPIAAVVVGRSDDGDSDTAALTDVLPLAAGSARHRGLAAILPRVASDHADADVVVADRSTLPDDLARAHGFLADDRLPLSAATTPTILISRLFDGTDDPPWELHGARLDALDDWTLTLAERNTF